VHVNAMTTLRVSGLNIAAKLNTGTGSELELGNNCGITNVASGRNVYLRPGPLGGAHVVGNTPFGWGSSTNTTATSMSLQLWNPAEHTLEQRNGTNAQTFRLYNTYTDASNYERTSITRDSSGLVIDAQKGGTGADPTNLLDLKLGGVSEFRVDQTGQIFGAGFSVGTAAGLLKLGSSTGSLYAYLSASSTQLNAQTLFINTAANDVTLAANGKDLLLSAGSGKTVKITHVAEVASSSTIAGLPASPVVGMVTRVTDGDSGLTFGNTVVNSGAGATPYLVWYNGTNWTVIGA